MCMLSCLEEADSALLAAAAGLSLRSNELATGTANAGDVLRDAGGDGGKLGERGAGMVPVICACVDGGYAKSVRAGYAQAATTTTVRGSPQGS